MIELHTVSTDRLGASQGAPERRRHTPQSLRTPHDSTSETIESMTKTVVDTRSVEHSLHSVGLGSGGNDTATVVAQTCAITESPFCVISYFHRPVN